MSRSRWSRPLLLMAMIGIGLAGEVWLAGPVAAQVTAGAYTPLQPVRLLDTRNSGQTLAGLGALDLAVVGGLVPSSATAVVLNVTVTNPQAAGFLSVYPAGQWSGTSSLNFGPAATVANLVPVGVGLGGDITAFNGSPGSTDLVVDLEGFFSPPQGSAGQYLAVSPTRIVDTRSGVGLGRGGQRLGPGGRLDVQVTGEGGLPSAGVSAVIVNLTATDTTASGYLTAWAQGGNQPQASNLDWAAGDAVSNQAILDLNGGGQVSLFNSGGFTDVIVDLVGYFTDGTGALGTGSYFLPMTPVRLLDTRLSGQTLTGGSQLSMQVAGMAGIAGSAVAALLNVTVTDTSAAGYLLAYAGSVPGSTSNLNWAPGQTMANLVSAPFDPGGALSLYNSAGSTDVIVDAIGYFTGPAAQVSVSVTPGSLPVGSSSTALVSIAVSTRSGPLGNDPVSLSSVGACGALTPTSTTTDASGLATATYTAAPGAGACVITVKESQGGGSGSATVTQSSGPANLRLTLATNPLLAGGSSSSVVTVVATDAKGLPIAGDSIYLVGAGDCGSLSPSVSVTGSSGLVSATYAAAPLSGFCSITATDSGGGGEASAEAIQTQRPAAADSIALSPNPASVAGVGSVNLTARVSGASPSGDPVFFTVTPKSCGSVSPGVLPADSGGVASTLFTAAGGAPVCTVTALEAYGGSSGSDTIYQQGGANLITVSAFPSSLPADGVSGSTISITVTSPAGNPVSESVLASLTGTCGSLSPAGPYATNISGQLTIFYRSGLQPGSCSLAIGDAGPPPGTGQVTVAQT